MKKYRIFISSVQSEFADERLALAEYICTDALLCRFFDVFLFEQAVASNLSPQRVYLGEVERCDIYLGLLGSMFGCETENGTSATESEYDLATQLGKTRFVFIKSVPNRDEREARFIAKVQGEVTRKSFNDFDSLRFAVYGALVRYLEQHGYVRTTPFDASFDTGLTINDIDNEKVEEFFKRARQARKITIPPDADAEWLLKKLDALSDDGKISNAAVLLFSKEPQRKFLSSEVKCLQYWGCEVERPIPSYRILHGGLIGMIEEALAFVMSRIDHEVGEPSGSGVAPGRDELPELAVREAIVNAVCHRDYADNGSVQVMLFSDRLEILNPGTLPLGWTVDRLLKTHDSKARNLTLAQALNWAGFVEKSGNGTEAIVHRCVAAGLPMPEYHPDNVDFKAIIWRNPKRLESVEALSRGFKPRHQVEAQSGPSQGPVGAQSQTGISHVLLGRESCLKLLERGDLGRKKIALVFKVSSRAGYFKRFLADLVEDGLIEYTIPDKPRSRLQKYRLTEKGKAVLSGTNSQLPTHNSQHPPHVS